MAGRAKRNRFILGLGFVLIGVAAFVVYARSPGFQDSLSVPSLMAVAATFCVGLSFLFAGFLRGTSAAIYGMLGFLCLSSVDIAKRWIGARTFSEVAYSLVFVLTPALVFIVVWIGRKRT